MRKQFSIYVDEETRDRLKTLAERESRSIINMLRVVLDSYDDGQLGSLSWLDRAVLSHVNKDEELDSLVEAMSFVIRDWVRLKTASRKNAGMAAVLQERGSDER